MRAGREDQRPGVGADAPRVQGEPNLDDGRTITMDLQFSGTFSRDTLAFFQSSFPETVQLSPNAPYASTPLRLLCMAALDEL